MIKILFICHGNICRSPMGEILFRALCKKAGKENQYLISSAATSQEELGNPIYPPVRKVLERHGLSWQGKTARQMTKADYDAYDLLIGMDQANIRNMTRIAGGDPKGKIHRLMTFAGQEKDVDDHWYTREFDRAYEEILTGCQGLWQTLEGCPAPEIDK